MLGEKIGELSGKVTSQRVLPNPRTENGNLSPDQWEAAGCRGN
jgi:hypothetical protein